VTDLGTGIREHGGGSLDGSLLGKLETLGSRLSGRNDLLLIVPRHVPTGTLLPNTALEVEFSLDGNTWTYAEIPLSVDALTDLGTRHISPLSVVAWGAKGIFWLLGMEA